MAKSGTQNIYFRTDENINKLTVNAGSTTVLNGIGNASNNEDFWVRDDLLLNGLLQSSASESLLLGSTFATNGSITLGGSVKATALANLHRIQTAHSGSNPTINIPECTIKTLDIATSGGTVTATGDLTLTTELEVNSGTTFNANGNTIAAMLVDVNGSGTLNIANSILNMNLATGYNMRMDAASIFINR